MHLAPGRASPRYDVAKESTEVKVETGQTAGSGQAKGRRGIPGIIGGTLRLTSAEHQRQLAEAADFLAAAGPEGPLALEIGFGDGSFLYAMARAHPGVRWLGLEVRRRLVEQTRAAARRRGLDNLHVLEGDARVILPALLPQQRRLQQVLILFPDPWWKQRHWKRRT
ncbi:MAG: hypothetical protein FJ125_16885, partial [Deltaproteobacteria bacterium]|nr:hypothetical protein [Deltaproteobacteria bacterium]